VFAGDFQTVFNFGLSVDRISLVTRFPGSVQTHYGANPNASKKCVICFPAVKHPGRGADHPPQQSPKLKSIGKLLSPTWIFMSCSRVKFYLYRLGLRKSGYVTGWTKIFVKNLR